jgi:hypothetical protein
VDEEYGFETAGHGLQIEARGRHATRPCSHFIHPASTSRQPTVARRRSETHR